MTLGKYILLLHLATAIGTASCEKKQDPPVRVEDLEGEWGWVRTDGGFAFHIHETPASAGKEIDLKITTNNKYSFYVKNLSLSDNAYDGIGSLYQKKQ